MDTARGAAILLVVLHHAVDHTVDLHLGRGLGAEVWTVVNESLRLVRLPLFFFLSGMLAERAVRRPWRELLPGRIGTNLWLYLLWSTIAFVVLALVPLPMIGFGEDVQAWARTTLWLPVTSIWYLLALAVFVALGRALRPVPTVWLLIVSGALSSAMASGPLVPWSFVWNDMIMLFVFFAAGLRLADLPRRFLDPRPRGATTALWVMAGAAAAVVTTLTGAAALPVVRLVVGAVTVVGGLVLAARIAESAVGRALAAAGRDTLGVYVTHQMVLAGLLTGLAWALGSPGQALDDAPEVWSWIGPAVLFVGAVAVSTPLGRALRGVPGALGAPWPTARR
ncbi:acyltransferase family protein [Kineococcus gynurae]|uniref:Acyltransferase family protein n=1 Tax=Kineococcus gynurae TaxID=452979 RepID=A0ABV5LQU5_9ACTN